MLPKYKRILLKLSGESLMGDKSFGMDPSMIEQYARDIKGITELGVQVAVVIGGGNIYRGMNEKETGIERAHGDYMGMLATVINGIGNPYFTTDTAGSLRAIEIQADVNLKGTRVDGIYTADPEKDPTAKKYNTITFQECISKNLKVMDMTAFTLCMENKLPIIVFDMNKPGNLHRVVTGEKVGTLVKD